MERDKQTTVAFVLSGGASLGAIQVGMLRALYERDITPDLIVGTSAGALNGAFIASRPQTTATADASRRSGAACVAGRCSRSTRSPGCSASSAPETTSSPTPACGG
jgi:predicted acylesterase/phospholipase RssA